ncbi:hypothetical protein niasHT_024775 [Heterodera trifolii]|uniref:Uncharacterized protein n=1 Tax=Heterodera trifolii TaxID=157864 RepID=A0ABD2JGZ7_9BILA
MSDNPNEAVNKIIISENGWRSMFYLLSHRQLGLRIALISPRFDAWVDEHFMARKWALGFIVIGCKITENGAKEMETNLFGRPLPIPKSQLPLKCNINNTSRWDLSISAFKKTFASASSSLVNFIVVIWFPLPFVDSVVPFDQTNELTCEQFWH